MNLYEIQAEYNSACQKATKLSNIANSFKKLSNVQLEENINTINDNWYSDCVHTFLLKLSSCQDKASSLEARLNGVANSIQTSAYHKYTSDMEAWRREQEEMRRAREEMERARKEMEKANERNTR